MDPALHAGEPDRPLRVTGAQRDGAGAGLEVVYLPLCVLVLIATVLVGFSAWRFRGQLS